jgi:alpha-tubulin suppressor-like RCC1 family protein
VAGVLVIAGVATGWAVVGAAGSDGHRPAAPATRAATSPAATGGVGRVRPRASTDVSYSCAVPDLGAQTFAATVEATSPTSVDAGDPLTVTGYQATTVLPADLVDDLIALGASSLTGSVTVADLGATHATPSTLNAAATPLPFSVPLTEGQSATIPFGPVSVGPFTAGPGGTIDITPGPITISGTFPVLGAESIPCTLATTPAPVLTSTTIIPGLLSLTTTSLPAGSVGTPYEAPLTAVGGVAPYSWSVTGGSLPPGLSLGAATGVISGDPTSVANASVTITVTDSSQPAVTAHSPALALSISRPVSARSLYGWGQLGQPGNTLASAEAVPTPVSLAPGTAATDAGAGVDDAIVLTSAGTVEAWGHNADGQLGDGTTTDRADPGPVLLPPGTTATAVSAGAFHNDALTATGGIEAWGADYYGQLGIGSTTGSATPVPVQLPGGVVATAVSAGGAHTLALTSTGAVLAWGRNADGQLGDGSTTDSDLPVAVHLPAGVTVTAVAAGGAQSLALTSTGAVLAWGANGNGQLGDGSTTDSDLPVAVHLPAGVTVTAIVDGAADGLALTASGTAYAWGYNHYGQLGIGSTANADTPTAVHLPAGTAAIGLGGGADANAALGLLGPATLSGTGYWTVASDGGLFAFGDAGFYGSTGGKALNRPIVGMAAHDHAGYWLVASDGGVFAYGDAGYFGSPAATPLNRPIVGMAATPDGQGYWLVASDGGIFSYGDAGFYGSTGGTPLNRPIVGMAATPDGRGYWLVAGDGGLFAFGDAAYLGSMGGHPLNRPIVGMAATPDGRGYWLVAGDGGLFAFGDAPFQGSMGGHPLNAPMVGMAATPDGRGYWTVAADGGIFAFGTADYFGSMGGHPLNRPMVGMTGA